MRHILVRLDSPGTTAERFSDLRQAGKTDREGAQLEMFDSMLEIPVTRVLGGGPLISPRLLSAAVTAVSPGETRSW